MTIRIKNLRRFGFRDGMQVSEEMTKFEEKLVAGLIETHLFKYQVKCEVEVE